MNAKTRRGRKKKHREQGHWLAGVLISGPALGFRGNGSSDRHCMLVTDIGEGEINPEGARRREVTDWEM